MMEILVINIPPWGPFSDNPLLGMVIDSWGLLAVMTHISTLPNILGTPGTLS